MHMKAQSKKDPKILFLFTGGTIDSKWDGKLDTAVVEKKSNIPGYMKSLILYLEAEFKEICMKDSRSLNGGDLKRLKEAIERTKYKHIIITHGTYTMPDTAKYLLANLKRKDQTIVLTGSMVPLAGFQSSDAPFNLGYAVSEVHSLPAGMYLCMNGRTFNPNEVAKNLSQGKFYSVFDKEQ
jgi:L-asparaginase